MLERMASSRPATVAGAKLRSAGRWCGQHLNFFRVHVLVFTFTPLIAAGIFYACNGENHIKFIDALFCCVTAMTVTGLTTINISTANGGQQAIMFILMCIGNISAVSVTMIWIRRSFFRKKFEHIVRRNSKVRKRMEDVEEQERRERRQHIAKLKRMAGLKSSDSATTVSDPEDPDRTDSSSSIEMRRMEKERKQQKNKGKRGPLRADMIRRIDGPAFLINSAGAPSNHIPDNSVIPAELDQLRTTLAQEPETTESPQRSRQNSASAQPGAGILTNVAGQSDDAHAAASAYEQPSIRISLPHDTNASDHAARGDDTTVPAGSLPRRRLSIPRFSGRHDPEADSDEEAVADEEEAAEETPRSPPLRARFPDQTSPGRGRGLSDPPQPRFRRGSDTGLMSTYTSHEKHDMFPRAQTVEFAVPSDYRSPSDEAYTTGMNNGNAPGMRHRNTTFNRTMTGRSYMSGRGGRGVPLARTQTSSKQRGFGGFPTPFEIAGFAIKKAIPGVQERFQRTMTMPRTSTFTSVRSGGGLTDGGAKPAPYLTFDATVTGNSRFQALTEAQRDELGGVEYRALDLLAKLVPAYWLIVNLGIVTMVAPYINSSAFNKYKPVFEEQGANAPNYTWFWFFQVISAYSNTGMSLIDTSMTQMQDAYFLLIPMGFLILAGNTAFPIFLRFFIWLTSICVPSTSRIYETLRFLLDHPRRCFIYLFPSTQTWILLCILLLFNITDWVAFLVLDIGNPVIEQIKSNIRVFDGLFQSIAVRAAGFAVVSLLALAPAVQFLYVIMMYLSAFPLAMSVRSTNVYEEKSLGVYYDEPPAEESMSPQEENNPRVWGSLLASHARRQLAFDIWWLGFALWLICIIERHDIQDPQSDGWFTIFSCLFELTSAYGTVGLSLGTPYDDFSLSGRFHTLSKLVVCAVMIRGRHRGLPVAIDRAILLPWELEQEDAEDDEREQDTWDRESTFVGPPRSGSGSSSSGGAGGFAEGNGMSAINRTQSGVSFAVGSPKTRRTSMPLSPKQHPEEAPRRSFTLTLPPSAMPLHQHHEGQLTAIDEMPSGTTPVSESRAPSPAKPPSFHSSPSPNSSLKGKEKEADVAQHAGCSTPEGMHDPVTGEL